MASGSTAMLKKGCRIPRTQRQHRALLEPQQFYDTGSSVRPARSIFSNVLNFCRSAIAALVRSP